MKTSAATALLAGGTPHALPAVASPGSGYHLRTDASGALTWVRTDSLTINGAVSDLTGVAPNLASASNRLGTVYATTLNASGSVAVGTTNALTYKSEVWGSLATIGWMKTLALVAGSNGNESGAELRMGVGNNAGRGLIIRGGRIDAASGGGRFVVTDSAGIEKPVLSMREDGSVGLNAGTKAVPALNFGHATTGLFAEASGRLNFALSGENKFKMSAGFIAASDMYLAFNNNVDTASGTPDVILRRDAAGQLSVRNALNPQSLAVYNTYADILNYERLRSYGQTGGDFVIASENAGSGVTRNLQIHAPQLKLYLGNFVTENTNPRITAYDRQTPADGKMAALTFFNVSTGTPDFLSGVRAVFRGGTNNTAKHLELLAGGDQTTAKMVVAGSGNVGIGTGLGVTPADRLMVADSIAAASGITVQNSLGTGNAASRLTLLNNSTDYLNVGLRNSTYPSYGRQVVFDRSINRDYLFQIGGADVFTIYRDGNVGIGTTVPGSKLDVSGNMAVSGNLRLGSTSAATSLGAVTRRLPIYDAAGVLLGYSPIYDSIT